MNAIKSFLMAISLMVSSYSVYSQTSENPWAIAVGADLINLQGDNVDSGLKFGAPALSLSRYLGAGFSVGAQYVIGNSENNNVDLDYKSLDGFRVNNVSVNTNFLLRLCNLIV